MGKGTKGVRSHTDLAQKVQMWEQIGFEWCSKVMWRIQEATLSLAVRLNYNWIMLCNPVLHNDNK